MCTNLWIHFVHRRMQDTIVILEEGGFPHPLCLSCEMSLPRAALNHRHPLSALCTWEAEIKRQRLEEEEARSGEVMALQAYDRPLEKVSWFKYLGLLLTVTENNWPAVIATLWS